MLNHLIDPDDDIDEIFIPEIEEPVRYTAPQQEIDRCYEAPSSNVKYNELVRERKMRELLEGL